jgi:bifunctional non-homologous end joining protein LigD
MARKPARSIDRATKPELFASSTNSLRAVSRPRPRPPTVGFIEPSQPIGAAKPPSGMGWLHEIKLDGFRLMAQRRGVGGRLLTGVKRT